MNETKMPEFLKIKENFIVLGRASVGIFLVLDQINSDKRGVIVPANICYAAIYPILYAGKYPVFCDVNQYDGNVTPTTFSKICLDQVCAAIFPHMYGNPIRDFPIIAQICKEKKITLIEDCASAMGATADYRVGSIGDYVVYSTGYSKTLDLGYGGFLCSDNSLKELEKCESSLPIHTAQNEQNEKLFSKIYRVLRNEGKNTDIEKMIYLNLAECMRGSFVHSIKRENKEELIRQVEKLNEVILERRKNYLLYHSYLEKYRKYAYLYSEGAVPWRYSLLIDPKIKVRLIRKLLDEGLPVSDWYPCVTPLFQDYKVYSGAKWHEDHIVNFPIMTSEVVIQRICETICGQLQKEGLF